MLQSHSYTHSSAYARSTTILQLCALRTTYCIYARSTVLCFQHKRSNFRPRRQKQKKKGCIFVGPAVRNILLGRGAQRKDSHKNTKRNNRNSCFIGWLKFLLSILDCFVCFLREEKKMKWRQRSSRGIHLKVMPESQNSLSFVLRKWFVFKESPRQDPDNFWKFKFHPWHWPVWPWPWPWPWHWKGEIQGKDLSGFLKETTDD